MQALDREVSGGNNGYAYMRRAGESLLAKVQELLLHGEFVFPFCQRPLRQNSFPPGWQQRAVLIVAGRGNNGGDGVVLAELLLRNKIPYQLLLLYPPQEFRGEAASAWKDYESAGGQASVFSGEFPATAGLVVDAMVGMGLHGNLRGSVLNLTLWIKEGGFPVLSVDVPSGVDSELVAEPQTTMVADWTLLMGFPRFEACLEYPGDAFGQWDFVDLQYSPEVVERNRGPVRVQCCTMPALAKKLPLRKEWREKRAQGVLGLIAGSRGMTGAAVMSAKAAMRSGAGMVNLACPSAELPVLASQLTEIVLHPMDSSSGVFLSSAITGVLAMLGRCGAGCVGPGISNTSEVQALVRQLTLDAQCPLIIDADGLNSFRGHAAMLRGLKQVPVLTPHEGEWERLFRIPAGTGWDRAEMLRSRCTEFGCVIVLKGAPTLVGTPSGEVYVVPMANSGLAKAGSGDVLAGIIASMRAQGADSVDSALLGVWIHARAGMHATREFGRRGAIPSDLISLIPRAILELESFAK
jgi:NAD(P)H-hydrate epimerase